MIPLTGEAFEEIGLSEKHIKRLGYLDITTTGTNYMILPVVGLIDIDFLPKINRNEVEDIIYLPLEFIEHKNNLKYVDKEFNGIRKSFYLYQYKEYSIWGATARILKTLSERFFNNGKANNITSTNCINPIYINGSLLYF